MSMDMSCGWRQEALCLSDEQKRHCFEVRRTFLSQLGALLRQRAELHALATQTCRDVDRDRLVGRAMAEETRGLLEVRRHSGICMHNDLYWYGTP